MYIGFLAGKCYKENSTVPSADDEGEEERQGRKVNLGEHDETDQEEDENAERPVTNISKTRRTSESVTDEGGHPCVPLRKRKSTCVDGQTSRRTFPELENNESTIGTVVPNEGLYTCSVCGKPYTYEGCMKTHEAKCVQTAPWISTKSPKKKAHIDS